MHDFRLLWLQRMKTKTTHHEHTHTKKKPERQKKKNKAPTHNQPKKNNKTNKISDFHLSEQNLKKKISKSLGPQTILCDCADKNSRTFRSTVIRIHQCKRHIDAIVSSAPKGDILLLSLLAPEKNNAHPNMKKKKNHKKFQTNTLSYLFLFKMTVGVSCVQ